MSDEHNPFYSSPYGHEFIHTPNMQKLADIGTLYQNTYCPSPLCLPSRSAFISGRRVHQIQAYSNCNVNLRKEFPSYGKILKDNGIYSVHIGKTDAYAPASQLGFSAMINPGERKEPGDTDHCRRPLSIRYGAEKRADGFGYKEECSSDVECVDKAVEMLKNGKLCLTSPWVLCVNIVNPHFPHFCPKDLWDRYSEREDLHKFGTDFESSAHPYAKDLRKHFRTDLFSENQMKGLRRGYYGCVSFVDRMLGRIITTLEESALLGNTNIVYTSDHGEMLGKFGMWWKCSLYEDSVRIPMIAAGPDFKRNHIVRTPTELLDLTSFIFASFGIEQPSECTGIPLNQIPEYDGERVVFSEYHGHGTRSGAFMVRKGKWKLIFNMEAENQLFNLAEDPNELKNLIYSNPDNAAALEKELRKICSPEEENAKAHKFEEEQFKTINNLKKESKK